MAKRGKSDKGGRGNRKSPRRGPPTLREEGKPRLDDPYLKWALDTGFTHVATPDKVANPSTPFPLLMELRQDITIEKFAELAAETEGAITVPKLFADPPQTLAAERHCVALVTRDFLEDAKFDSLRDMIERFELGLPGLEFPSALPGARELLSKPTVLTAVIDDGLAFAHRRFRRADRTTRVEYLWRQGEVPLVLSGTEIDNAITGSTHAGLVDEDEVYRTLRHENFLTIDHKTLSRRRAHGAHIMDLACGAEPGSLDDQAIIGVQFPGELIRDTSGAWLHAHILGALWFILLAAEAIAAKNSIGSLPIVVNVSYGKYADSHDGKSLLESAIDRLVRFWSGTVAPLAVVLPSGNNHLARCHASFRLAAGARRSLRWRVQPDDRTPSFLEVWPGPPDHSGVAPNLRVTLVPPPPGQALKVTRGQFERWPVPTEELDPFALWSADYRAAGPQTHRDRIQLSIAPTVAWDERAVAPAGTWEVLIENLEASGSCQVEAWIQRDDTPYGWPITGRQSRFDDPDYDRFDPSGAYDRARFDGSELCDDDPMKTTVYAKRRGSVNAIATGNEPVVIGAFRKGDKRACWYTAGGPLRSPGARVGPDPDAMAVGDESVACHGVLAAGTHSGSVVAMRGTSVAAPQITRWLAGRMANRLGATRADVQAEATAKDPGTPPISADRMGAGRLDVRGPPRVSRSSPD